MNRTARLMTALREKHIPAAVFHSRENIRYLSGYTGEGCLFVCEQFSAILTDFRYTEIAGIEAPECRVVRTRYEGVTEQSAVRALLNEIGASVLGMETNVVTFDQYSAYRDALPGVTLVSNGTSAEEMREIKDQDEVDRICEASRIACAAFDHLLGWMKPGMTEKQIQAELDYTMIRLGSDEAAFPTIAVAGVNGSLPHGVPSDHVVQNGELLTLDFGAQVKGYKCDMTRTVGFGTLSDDLVTMYEAVLTAQKLAMDAIRPGACCGDVDAIARDYLDARYPGCFGHGLGHAVGLFIHENPRFSAGAKTILRPGHVMTVEPGVYVPGKYGCRIEDTVLITEDGFIDPIIAPKHLIRI